MCRSLPPLSTSLYTASICYVPALEERDILFFLHLYASLLFPPYFSIAVYSIYELQSSIFSHPSPYYLFHPSLHQSPLHISSPEQTPLISPRTSETAPGISRLDCLMISTAQSIYSQDCVYASYVADQGTYILFSESILFYSGTNMPIVPHTNYSAGSLHKS